MRMGCTSTWSGTRCYFPFFLSSPFISFPSPLVSLSCILCLDSCHFIPCVFCFIRYRRAPLSCLHFLWISIPVLHLKVPRRLILVPFNSLLYRHNRLRISASTGTKPPTTRPPPRRRYPPGTSLPRLPHLTIPRQRWAIHTPNAPGQRPGLDDPPPNNRHF